MMRPVAAVCLLIAALGAPVSAFGHGGGAPSLVVPVDYIGPGLPFPIIAADLGADAVVDLRMVRSDRTADLGTVTAGPDGHFEAYMTLPEDYPTGAAQLVAVGDDGSQASLDLVIGQKRVIQNNSPAAWWQDPSVLLLAGIVGAAIVLGSWALLRGRAAAAPALAGTTAARRRVPRKARRG